MKALVERVLKPVGRCFACLSLVALPALTHAAPEKRELGYLTKAATGEGFHFTHHDWEVACDNTRTCRAGGLSHGFR